MPFEDFEKKALKEGETGDVLRPDTPSIKSTEDIRRQRREGFESIDDLRRYLKRQKREGLESVNDLRRMRAEDIESFSETTVKAGEERFNQAAESMPLENKEEFEQIKQETKEKLDENTKEIRNLSSGAREEITGYTPEEKAEALKQAEKEGESFKGTGEKAKDEKRVEFGDFLNPRQIEQLKPYEINPDFQDALRQLHEKTRGLNSENTKEKQKAYQFLIDSLNSLNTRDKISSEDLASAYIFDNPDRKKLMQDLGLDYLPPTIVLGDLSEFQKVSVKIQGEKGLGSAGFTIEGKYFPEGHVFNKTGLILASERRGRAGIYHEERHLIDQRQLKGINKALEEIFAYYGDLQLGKIRFLADKSKTGIPIEHEVGDTTLYYNQYIKDYDPRGLEYVPTVAEYEKKTGAAIAGLKNLHDNLSRKYVERVLLNVQTLEELAEWQNITSEKFKAIKTDMGSAEIVGYSPEEKAEALKQTEKEKEEIVGHTPGETPRTAKEKEVEEKKYEHVKQTLEKATAYEKDYSPNQAKLITISVEAFEKTYPNESNKLKRLNELAEIYKDEFERQKRIHPEKDEPYRKRKTQDFIFGSTLTNQEKQELENSRKVEVIREEAGTGVGKGGGEKILLLPTAERSLCWLLEEIEKAKK